MADDDDDEDLPPEDYDEPAAFDPQDTGEQMNGQVLTPLIMQNVDGTTFILHEPLVYRRVCGEIITVPKGFDHDLASVPWLFRRVFPRSGPYNDAAVVHDWLYETRKIGPHVIYRAEADAVFLEAMEALGCGWLTRTLIYRAVRVGGWVVWNRRRMNAER
jgi:hypothetical protein